MDRKFTLINVYLPNNGQKTFLYRVFKEMVVLGGDPNFVVDPVLDSSSFSARSSFPALTVKQKFHSLQLVDSWRVLHPKDQEYTHYSAPHDT